MDLSKVFLLKLTNQNNSGYSIHNENNDFKTLPYIDNNNNNEQQLVRCVSEEDEV